MRFIPHYCVSYHGTFHNTGCAFEIDREDAEEMSRHGTIVEGESAAMEGESAADDKRKPGRPRKHDTE